MDNQMGKPDKESPKIETKKFDDDALPTTERVTSQNGSTPLSSASSQADAEPSIDELSGDTASVPTMTFEAPADIEPLIRYGDVLLSDFTTLCLQVGGDKRLGTIETEIKDSLTVGRIVEGDPAPPKIDLGPFNAYEHGVSRLHVKIVRQADTLYIIDLSSRNGTYLNGIRLHPHQARVLRDNDELVLGRLSITVCLIGVESLDN